MTKAGRGGCCYGQRLPQPIVIHQSDGKRSVNIHLQAFFQSHSDIYEENGHLTDQAFAAGEICLPGEKSKKQKAKSKEKPQKQFAPEFGDKVRVNAILCNDVDEAQMMDTTHTTDVLSREKLQSRVLSHMTDVNGNQPALMKLHTGQKLTFGGAQLDVLFTHEDLFGTALKNFNDLCTIVKVTLGGNRFFMTADASNVELPALLAELPASVLESEFCQMGHHGADRGYKPLYEAVKAKYILYPNSEKDYNRDMSNSKYDWCQYIKEHHDELYLADTYCYTFMLPYTPESAIKWNASIEKPSDAAAGSQNPPSASVGYGDTIPWTDGKAR